MRLLPLIPEGISPEVSFLSTHSICRSIYIAASREEFSDKLTSYIGCVRRDHNIADGITNQMPQKSINNLFRLENCSFNLNNGYYGNSLAHLPYANWLLMPYPPRLKTPTIFKAEKKHVITQSIRHLRSYYSSKLPCWLRVSSMILIISMYALCSSLHLPLVTWFAINVRC